MSPTKTVQKTVQKTIPLPQVPLKTPSKTPVAPQVTGQSGFDQAQANNTLNVMQAQLQPKNTTVVDNQQTSRPDAVASLNSVMSSLFGRLATTEEQARYIPELNAYQAAHPTTGNQQLVYDEKTGKPLQGTNTMTSTSTSPDAYFQSILQGTAEAGQHRVINGYLGALMQLSNSAREG